jgi:uncharacterized membrane protein
MQKQFYFLIILTFLILVVGGIFLWGNFSKEAEEWLPGVRYESPENYVIKDTTEEIIVENKSAGISFKVPNEWTADKEQIGIDEWIVNVSSPEAEVDEYNFLTKGCGISIAVMYHKLTIDAAKERIEDPERFSDEISGDYEIIEISGHSALKTILENPEWGQSVTIEIPVEDKIHMFDTMFLPEETSRCSQAFEEFLAGVSIY